MTDRGPDERNVRAGDGVTPSGRQVPITEWIAAVVALLLIAAGYLLAIATSAPAPCCDAVAYLEEAQSIVDGQAEFLPVHNYAYAGFLALLEVVGLGSPTGIAVAQTTLLYGAVLAAALVIGRSTRSSVALATVWLAAVALVPAAAWTGQVFSEGLAAPVLYLVLALTILAIFRLSSNGTGWLVVIAWGMLCGLAWMVRPGLIWIPVAMGFILIALCLHLAWQGHRRALLLPIGFVVSVMLVAAPQFQYEDPLKTELADLQGGHAPLVFRYATELTAEGPGGLVFTPLPQGEEWNPAVSARRAAGSRQWQLTAMAAHIVSGWDARPSPSYLYADTGNRWIVVSAFSGFLIVGVLSVLLMIWQRRWNWLEPGSYTLIALVFVFALSQAALSMTSTEFRFNLPGWIIAAFCLAMISALGWWTMRRAAIALVLGLLFSGGVILFGQVTLMYSDRWLEYLNMISRAAS